METVGNRLRPHGQSDGSDTKYRDTADRNTIPFLDSTQSAFSLEAKYDDIADGATK